MAPASGADAIHIADDTAAADMVAAGTKASAEVVEAVVVDSSLTEAHNSSTPVAPDNSALHTEDTGPIVA